MTTCARSKASRVAAGIIGILAAGAAVADSPASPPPASGADAPSEWHSMPQDGVFSSIKQNLRESEQEVVRGHFELGEPPNVRRYYCLVDPKNGRREPNGVLGNPVSRPDGMTGIKIDTVSMYTCARAEQKGYLVSAGYVLLGAALTRSAPPAAASTPQPPAVAPAVGAPPAAAPPSVAPAPAVEAPPPAVRLAADPIDVAGVRLLQFWTDRHVAAVTLMQE